MSISRNKLYKFLLLACLAGYIWVIFNASTTANEKPVVGGCLFKYVTNIPCPSCGSTRAVVCFFKGEFLQSIYWNPMGVILIIIMFLTPVWLGYDYINKKDTLLRFYIKTETVLRTKKIGIPLIILVILNWIWNIYKGL